jgi:hypothetical protein
MLKEGKESREKEEDEYLEFEMVKIIFAPACWRAFRPGLHV